MVLTKTWTNHFFFTECLGLQFKRLRHAADPVNFKKYSDSFLYKHCGFPGNAEGAIGLVLFLF